jgi:hypothetical protein
MHGIDRNAYKILVGNHEGKRPFGKPTVNGRITLKINIKWTQCIKWIPLALDKVQC